MKVLHSPRRHSVVTKLLLLVSILLYVPEMAWASLPPGWSDVDIGSPAIAGSASSSAGLWTVAGGGADIWNAADQFHFVSTNLTGDGTLIVNVQSVQNTDPGSGWSKAGLMFRNDSTAGSANVSIVATAGQGVSFQWRSTAGGSSSFNADGGITVPVWLKLVRAGANLTGYYSQDGSNWVLVASHQVILNNTVMAGLDVTAHNNSALNTATFTNFTLYTPPRPVFGVYRELWTNLNSSIGNTLAVLTNTTYNPNWPNNPSAAYSKVFPGFETEINDGMSYYGQRLRAFLVPPVSGNYTLWIASDDSSTLFISTDETPGHKTAVASVSTWTSSRDFSSEPNQQSPSIYLQGGQRYYVEALMQQGGGGDNLAVQWELPDGNIEVPLATGSAAGTLLVPYTGQMNKPGIYSQAAANTSVVENSSAVISLLVTNQAEASYQWLLNGTTMPGANSSVLALSNAKLAWDGSTFTCVVTNASGSVTSAPALLTVVPDTTPPTVLQVVNLGLTNVQVTFSEMVEASSATNIANYIFTNGLAVTGASLSADGQTVVLTTAPLAYGSNYTFIVNNVRDVAATPNTIAPDTVVTFFASPYAPLDLGKASVISTVAAAGNGFNITAAGSDFGGNSDQGNFSYQLANGNFDVAVRVAGLSLSDIFAKAGLMARETLAVDSRFAAAFTTPAMNGSFFEWRDPAGTGAKTIGNFPANYPNTWLRLGRVGNTFTAFASYDGQVWTPLGSQTIAMPSQIYLGFSVSSRSASVTALAQFRDITTVTNGIMGLEINPHDAMGPSSRKSPVAFSEIMWKPAPRTDGKNLEFIELYNSNPWFQDISGYRITCADVNYTFPPNTQIPGGGYLVVAASPADIQAVYGITNVIGPYVGSLKKSETLELLDEQGAVLLTVPYTAVYPWPVATGGTGHSLVLAYPTYGEADPRAWDISDTVGGSPGQMDSFTPSALRNVVINEILPHSENAGVPQFIELYNHATNSIDVSGCVLTDDPATNKVVIPPGTIIGPTNFLAFTQSQFNFTLKGGGETLYFIKPDGSRILDAVQFGAQSDGVSFGRWPDGANDFYNFTSRTPGANNSSILIDDIVINELMYRPISGNDDDQYIELYNQGTNTVNLAGWQLSSAVSFTFPSITIAPNGYVVIARNLTNLLAKYPNLNSGNTVGNYSGKLSHNGELLVLSMPQTLNTNTPILVAEDQVAYGVGGRWGEWSGGGGSSLELKDPRSNHRLAANWADSDETQKSVWTNIECTGVLDNGGNFDPSIQHAQIGVLDVGECLVDNIEVIYNGSNYVANGTFESGTNGWTFQGDMVRSSLENSGYLSGHSLHIRCSDRIWTGANSCEMDLKTNSLAEGATATLRFKAKWLHGWPEPLMRLNGNWIEATAAMPVPANLGTPGMPNSQYAAGAGPAIYSVTHNPPLPAANQPVVVTAQVHDPNGVQSLVLNYRIDPATSYTSVPMQDNGTGGDAVAGDGVFSATIPGRAANTLVAFYISAANSNSVATRFPAIRASDNEPIRECAVTFGDGNPGGSFGVYHLWLTQSNINRWSGLSDLSNEYIDGTMVCGNRVIYNMGGRFSGSPYHQGFNSPAGNLCHYKWQFNDDDKFLGVTSFNKLHQPGNAPGEDPSLQREQIANSFERALGVPWVNRRLVAVYVNGNRRGLLMEDAQTPGSDVVKEQFPNDTDGWLYKMQPWFEFGQAPAGDSIPFNNNSWCLLNDYTTTGSVKKMARYRYNYEVRRTPDSDNNFTSIYSLVDAACHSTPANFVASMENIADMENWMRVFAANHAVGNWDSFGAQNEQNVYGYVGALGTKYTLLMFDLDVCLGNSSSWGPGQNLLTINGGDQGIANIFHNPTFMRMYWRAIGELINGPLDVANSAPLIEARYNAMKANGLNVENPKANIEPWITQARSSIMAQLATINAGSFTVNPSVSVSNNVAYVTGTAAVNVDSIWINGAAYPLNWINLTNWIVSVPLATGSNNLSVIGVDRNGRYINGDTNSVSANSTATNSSPVGQVVINEIMYAPLVDNAQFVELYNNSTNTSFDISGWKIQALNYTFPTGSIIAPTNYLVLAANGPAFAAAYGATNRVFDIFTGSLSVTGARLILANVTNGVVAQVQYASRSPWPTNASGTGASLQLIDSHQDNWREGNWLAVTGVATPGSSNSVAAPLSPFPPLWINEVQPNNLTGITNSIGQHVPWVELFNPSTNTISLNGLYLANNYTNLQQWAFPSGASINPGQFEVIFVDGQTNLTISGELHAGFTLAGTGGSVVLSRLGNTGQVLDYLDYQTIAPNDSYGSYPDGQSFVRQEFFRATPGATNNGTATPPPSFVAYIQPGSVYTQNFDSLPNPGATSVNTANPVTINGVTYSLTKPYDFAGPVGASGGGGLGLSPMAGWYGSSTLAARFGATFGDQTTGGQISFGLANNNNRALGLLATSSTGGTSFGLRLINGTGQTLKFINLQYTGEVWRQSDIGKTLQFYYSLDASGTNTYPDHTNAFIPALNVNIPTVPADSGGVAVNGTLSLNQTNLNATNQLITPWLPGTALWLMWQMTDQTGKAQGLGIDNLSFSASVLPVGFTNPAVATSIQPDASLNISCATVSGLSYQLEANNDLTSTNWIPVGAPVAGTGNPAIFNLPTTNSPSFFRVRVEP